MHWWGLKLLVSNQKWDLGIVVLGQFNENVDLVVWQQWRNLKFQTEVIRKRIVNTAANILIPPMQIYGATFETFVWYGHHTLRRIW